MRRYLLYIGAMADALFTMFTAPVLAVLYMVPTLRLNPALWVPFLLCTLIWLFCTGYWGMEKIGDAYRTFRNVDPAR